MADIPLLVKHMTVAVYRSAKLSGTELERFEHAFKIARGRCVQYGLIGPDGEADPERIGLTAKGSAREVVHLRERDGASKTALFDQLHAAHHALKKSASPSGDVGPALPPKPLPTPKQALVDKLRQAEERAARGERR